MQVEAPRSSRAEVRCLCCHAVYELPVDTAPREAPGCPDCGAVVWLAATIPVSESEPLANA